MFLDKSGTDKNATKKRESRNFGIIAFHCHRIEVALKNYVFSRLKRENSLREVNRLNGEVSQFKSIFDINRIM